MKKLYTTEEGGQMSWYGCSLGFPNEVVVVVVAGCDGC